MANKVYKKGKVHPADDHLSLFLPAAILALAASLPLHDKEVLAYFIFCSGSGGIELVAARHSSKEMKGRADHAPEFECLCFRCYVSFWSRWDSSTNRHVIDEIIEAFEEHERRAVAVLRRRGRKEWKKRGGDEDGVLPARAGFRPRRGRKAEGGGGRGGGEGAGEEDRDYDWVQAKRKHIYWTPCAAHCIDLMLEDIGKISQIKRTVEHGIFLVGFIYNHTTVLNIMRTFTEKRELVRYGITRFATTFLTLQRLHKLKSFLRKMFTSNECVELKLSKQAKGKRANAIVLKTSFWNLILYTLKVMVPLVSVLRLVDNEKNAAMGYIYEAMDRAKEAIQKSLLNKEEKYRDIFELIDRRWESQMHHPLHAAGHFLNP